MKSLWRNVGEVGGSPEDVATRPAAYRLPPPEQLPEISRIDEMCSVPEGCELLELVIDPLADVPAPDVLPVPDVEPVPDVLPVPDVEPVPVAVLPVPAVEPAPLPYDDDEDELSSVPRISTRWFTYCCRSLLSLPVRRYAFWLLLMLELPAVLPPAVVPPAVVPPAVVPLVPLVPAVELPVPLVEPPAVVELEPEPIDAFVRMNCPSLPLDRLALVLPAAPVEPAVEPVPDVPVALPLAESALTRQPVTVTV